MRECRIWNIAKMRAFCLSAALNSDNENFNHIETKKLTLLAFTVTRRAHAWRTEECSLCQ